MDDEGQSKGVELIIIPWQSIQKVSVNPEDKEQPSYSIFHDETLVSFRRPSFSPDGSLLCLPTGQRTPLSPKSTQHGIYLNLRNNLHKTPQRILEDLKGCHCYKIQSAILSSFEGWPRALRLPPYRMIFALVTQNSVYILTLKRVRLSSCLPICIMRLWLMFPGQLMESNWSPRQLTVSVLLPNLSRKWFWRGEILNLEEGEKIIKNACEMVKAAQFFESTCPC